MRLAAVDIGTNTVRLLIAEVAGATLTSMVRDMSITRLGFGVHETRRLAPEAMRRTIDVLKTFKQRMDGYGVERYEAFATSAVRDSINSSEFIDRVRQEAGLEVVILHGEEEARRSFRGATTGAPFATPGTDVVVVDIGGGSTELAFGRGTSLEFYESLDIGSVRLTEMYVRGDPPGVAELQALAGHIQDALGETVNEILAQSLAPFVVGVAGTITTLVTVRDCMPVYDPEKVHLAVLSKADIRRVLDLFLGMPLAERRRLPGLEPERADVIIAGTVVADEVMRMLGAGQMTVSEHDILDGTIWVVRSESEREE